MQAGPTTEVELTSMANDMAALAKGNGHNVLSREGPKNMRKRQKRYASCVVSGVLCQAKADRQTPPQLAGSYKPSVSHETSDQSDVL